MIFKVFWQTNRSTWNLFPHWNITKYLKAYSLMSNRGRSQNFKKMRIFCIFVFHSSKKHTSPNELKSFQYETRAILFSQKSLGHETLFNTVVYGSNEIHTIMHNLQWRSQGAGGKRPLAETLPLSCPLHFVQRSIESRHFESKSAPPRSLVSRPLILKSLATPLN